MHFLVSVTSISFRLYSISKILLFIPFMRVHVHAVIQQTKHVQEEQSL